jgi:hypothetical protein
MTIMAKTTDLTGISQKLPAEINGWKKAAAQEFYNPDTLFKYINGGAELYISYNFKQVSAQKYDREGYPQINLDIFDMGNSYSAFGVFSHSRESVDRVIGDAIECEYGGGLLTFWKGRFYISILAYPETDEIKKTVLQLGRHIAGLIGEESRKPRVISLLPTENLDLDTVRYFQHHAWMNSHYYISDQNILHIGKDTHAVLAAYRENKQKHYLLIVTYPDETKAKAAYRSFMETYLPDAHEGLKQLEDGRWTGCELEGKRVAAVLDAPGAGKVKALLKQIKNGGKNDR